MDRILEGNRRREERDQVRYTRSIATKTSANGSTTYGMKAARCCIVNFGPLVRRRRTATPLICYANNVFCFSFTHHCIKQSSLRVVLEIRPTRQNISAKVVSILGYRRLPLPRTRGADTMNVSHCFRRCGRWRRVSCYRRRRGGDRVRTAVPLVCDCDACCTTIAAPGVRIACLLHV